MKRYRLSLTVQGPILTASTAAGRLGLDTPAARCSDGRWMIAGTHVTGKLYQALEELHEAADYDPAGETISLFRAWRPEDQDNGDRALLEGDERAFARAQVHIGDLTTDAPGEAARERTRIAVDDVSGVAHDGALQVMQEPFAPGESVRFEGTLTIVAPEDECDAHAERLHRALHWIPQIGSGRTIGMGRLTAATLTPVAEPSPSCVIDGGVADRGRYNLILAFEEGFCCAKPARHRNVFASESIVPGAVIKGALAGQMLALAGKTMSGDATEAAALFPALAEYFERLHVTHAFPASLDTVGALGAAAGGQLTANVKMPPRPRVPPLSLAAVGTRVFDLALYDKHDPVGGKAPAFRADWKGSAQAQADAITGWHEPKRELRVRTRMSRRHRAAEPQNLFAVETVVPDGFVWVADLDLTRCGDFTRARDELQQLLRHGLSGIGKTNAFARVFLLPKSEPEPMSLLRDEQVVVVLQSAALLLPPDPANLMAEYERTFRDLAGAAARVGAKDRDKAEQRGREALELSRIYTDEALFGGMYMALRFFRGRASEYRPFIVTQPGSVFAFTVKNHDVAERVLTQWATRGLGVPARVLSEYVRKASNEPLWKCCPFVPENGFGEVIINDPLHWGLRPNAQTVLTDEP